MWFLAERARLSLSIERNSLGLNYKIVIIACVCCTCLAHKEVSKVINTKFKTN